MIGYRVDSATVSVRRACERSSVGHFIVLFFPATPFYSTISLFHDMQPSSQLIDTMSFEFHVDKTSARHVFIA